MLLCFFAGKDDHIQSASRLVLSQSGAFYVFSLHLPCLCQGRKKSQKKSADLGSMNWEVQRDHGLKAVLQLLRLNVHRLWEPPVMEEEFVS